MSARTAGLISAILLACAGPPDVEVEPLDGLPVPDDATAVWRLDTAADPTLRFEATGLLGIPAAGVWQRYAVQVAERSADPTTWSIGVVIDMDSVQTGQARLDEHLRTPDFLDVTGHPEARFDSTALVPTDGDRWQVEGDLTVRGTTRPVTWETTLSPAGDTLRTTATLPLSRDAFGLYADDVAEPGGDGAADEVVFAYDVTLARTALDGSDR